MTEFLQSVVGGLGAGSTYALIALGFVTIYKSTGVVSFGQPAFMLTGAVVVSYLVADVGFFPAVALAMLGVAILALGTERLVVRPMLGGPLFAIAIITLGVDVVVRVAVDGFIGSQVLQVGDPWGLDTVRVAGVIVQQRHLATVVTTVVVVTALFAFFRYARFGLAMRAAAFDREAALTQGVSVSTVSALSWALAGALAAVAGAFVAIGSGIDQQLWVVALKAFPAVIIGGLDSLAGALAGGLVVGVVESLVGTYQTDVAPWLGQNAAVVSPYVVMVLVLLVRPYGLFGTRKVERV